jgi:hypothetical protein
MNINRVFFLLLTLMLTFFSSCDKEDNTPTKINLGSDTTIVFGDTLILDAGFGFDSYTWNNGLSDEQKLKVTNEGNYWVVATKNNTILSDTIQIDTIRSCFYECDTTVQFFEYCLKIPCSYSYEDCNGDDSRYIKIKSEKQDIVMEHEIGPVIQYDIFSQLPGTYNKYTCYSNKMFILNNDNREIGVVYFERSSGTFRNIEGFFLKKENSYYQELMQISYSSAKKYEVIEILRTLKLQ